LISQYFEDFSFNLLDFRENLHLLNVSGYFVEEEDLLYEVVIFLCALVGFNAAMQAQVMDAINDVAPRALDSIKVKAFHKMREGNPDWFKSRFELLDRRFGFANLACRLKDPNFLREVMLAGGAVKVFERCPVAAKKAIAIDPPLAMQLARDENVRQKVVCHNTTPPALLRQLARDEDWHVRERVAGNASTPPAALEQLAGDEINSVRQGVAENTNTPIKVLEQFARDENRMIREGA